MIKTTAIATVLALSALIASSSSSDLEMVASEEASTVFGSGCGSGFSTICFIPEQGCTKKKGAIFVANKDKYTTEPLSCNVDALDDPDPTAAGCGHNHPETCSGDSLN